MAERVVSSVAVGRRAIGAALLAVVLVVGGAAIFFLPAAMSRSPEVAGLEHVLAHRGRVAFVGQTPALHDVEGLVLAAAGTTTPIGRSLREDDPVAVLSALREARTDTLLIDVPAARREAQGSVIGRIARFHAVPGFRTLFLSASWVVVTSFAPPSLTEAERVALARVARQILAGSQPPRLAQFPAGLRAPYPGEVLLLLRRASGDLALWRSARASSLASGLLTAVGVARQRWDARTSTLGGSLGEELPRFTVEVALLVDDGTLGTRSPGFVDEAITEDHGVAYDDPSMWRYLLPESDERRRAGSGSAAYRALFRDNQLRDDAFEREDLRLYRVRVLPLSTSAATR